MIIFSKKIAPADRVKLEALGHTVVHVDPRYVVCVDYTPDYAAGEPTATKPD